MPRIQEGAPRQPFDLWNFALGPPRTQEVAFL